MTLLRGENAQSKFNPGSYRNLSLYLSAHSDKFALQETKYLDA